MACMMGLCSREHQSAAPPQSKKKKGERKEKNKPLFTRMSILSFFSVISLEKFLIDENEAKSNSKTSQHPVVMP